MKNRKHLGGGLLRLAVISASFAVLLSVGPPALAGLSNAIPANESGDPTDSFTDDEAVFAYVLSDVKGGEVCIVAGSFSEPSGLDCSAEAWGGKNTVVGIGTQFVPIAAPPLKPGTWRLLTTDSEGGSPKLSEPFTVSPCTLSQCDFSIAQGILADYKAAAERNLVVALGTCLTFSAKSINGVLTKARGRVNTLDSTSKDYSTGGGFAALVVGGAGFGLSFVSLPSLANPGEEKAMEILKNLTCTLSSMYSDIVADPPDPAYTTVVAPEYSTIPTFPDATQDTFAAAVDRQRGLGVAALRSLERYQAALTDDARAFIHAQAAAIDRFTTEQIDEIRRTAAGARDYIEVLNADPDFATPAATAQERDELISLYQRIQASGFTQDEMDRLQNLGYTQAEIDVIRSHFDIDPMLLPADQTVQSVLEDFVSTLESGLSAFDLLARNAASVAGRSNEPPVPSFTATPSTGTAPLPVNFVDTSTSLDLDAIVSVSWDFGDGERGEGASVTHTFQSPGDYPVIETVCDYLRCATATRQITVSQPAQNHPPVAVEDSLTMLQDTVGTVDVLANDSDPDSGDPLTVTGSTDGAHGTVSCQPAGDCTYTPAPGYTGPDSFTYTIDDGNGGTATATVSVTVNSVGGGNNPPVAVDDSLTTQQDTAGNVNVLANDSDPDPGDTLTVTGSTDGAHGTVSCQPAGDCTYTPAPGYTGPDSFTYTIDDGNGGTAVGTVSVTVNASIGIKLREITADNPQSCSPFNVGLAFDGTNLLVSCVGSGVIDKIDPSDGSLVGQITVPGESVLGALSYDRSRGKLWACTFGGAERVMLIDPVDGSKDAEFASNGCGDGLAYDGDDDTLWAGADQVCTVTHYRTDGTVIGAFDVCPLIGGTGKSGIAVGGGKLYVARPAGSQVYEVEKDFSASSLLFQTDRFLEDLECDDVTFAPKSAMWVQAAFDRILTAIEIPAGACPFGGGNSPPVAVDDALTTQQDTAGSVNVLANDSDPDPGDTLTVTGSTDGAHGTVSCQPAGDCTYTPAPGYTGPDSFTDTISDGRGGSATATVSVDVFEPASPVALVSISTNFNSPIGIDYHQPTNKVAVSVNYSSGLPLNFELIAEDGSHAPFSSISGFTDEVKIGTVRSSPCRGGFQVGELFTGTGVPGVIARIAPDGSSVANPWVTLHDEFGLMRGSLFQDRYCSFGGDLIAVTTAGGVWRVTSAGEATRIAQIDTHLEGLTTVPDDPARYGPWAGKLLAGAEGQSRVYAIATDGTVTPYELGIAPEDIDIVPAKENFFGVDFAAAEIKGAPASEFADKVGDVVIAQEFPGILWDVHWNAAVGAFQVSEIARVGQWEHVTFAPAGISPLPPTNSAPVASDSSATTTEGTPVEVTLQASDPDGDALTYSIVSGPTHGSLAGSDAARAYTPDAGYTGPDSFTFKASDGSLDSNVAMVSITVAAVKRSTSTAYTGTPSAQYSDPVALSGTLLDTSATPNVGIPGKQLDFTLGTRSRSAGPTAADGSTSTSLVVTQQPGSVTSVGTSFAGDASYLGSSDSDPFTISKEDCILAYSGDLDVAPTAMTTLAADFGEPDTSLGDRSNKTVVFTLTGVVNATPRTYPATTDGSGHASIRIALPSDVYAARVSFPGDSYYKSCATTQDAVVTVEAAAAKVTGGGWISIGTGRTSFGFNAIPEAGGLWKGQFQLRSNNNKSKFHSSSVSTLSGSRSSASWSGIGNWNGQLNYAYTISVVDNGSPGKKKADTISITITSPAGLIVFSTGGPQTLKGGNLTVH